MTSASYRLDSFRSWNPFHDKPATPNLPSKHCRYPSPVSMTATPTSLADDVAPKAQNYTDRAKRHPLPPRPPEPVCVNVETRSRSQSTMPDFGHSPQTVTAQDGPRHFSVEEYIPAPERPDLTDPIDPAILNDNPCSSPARASDASPCQDLDLTSIMDTNSSPQLTFDDIHTARESRQNTSGCPETSNPQPTSVAKRLNHRRKTRGVRSSGLISSQMTSSENGPTFSSIRSQFLVMPFQDRLQFVSWLFESALSQCIPPPTGLDITSTTNHGPCLHPYTAPSFEDRSSAVDGAETLDRSPRHGSYLEPHNNKPLRIEEERNWPDDDQLEYEIEKILRHRKDSHGSVSYLVQWKGYEDIDATWEPRVSLQDTVALEVYESQLVFASDKNSANPSRNRCAGRPRPKFRPYRRGKSVINDRSMQNGRPTRKGRRMSPNEIALLSKLKVEENLTWSVIHQEFSREFPGRTKGSLQVYWSTRMKENLPNRDLSG